MLSTDDATSPSADVSNFHGGRGVAISRNGDDHDEGDDYEGEEDEDDNSGDGGVPPNREATQYVNYLGGYLNQDNAIKEKVTSTFDA